MLFSKSSLTYFDNVGINYFISLSLFIINLGHKLSFRMIQSKQRLTSAEMIYHWQLYDLDHTNVISKPYRNLKPTTKCS